MVCTWHLVAAAAGKANQRFALKRPSARLCGVSDGVYECGAMADYAAYSVDDCGDAVWNSDDAATDVTCDCI